MTGWRANKLSMLNSEILPVRQASIKQNILSNLSVHSTLTNNVYVQPKRSSLLKDCMFLKDIQACICHCKQQASRVILVAVLSWLLPQTVLVLFRREDDSLHFCPHRFDCLHAPIGWQGSWNFPRHTHNCQLCHVHYDPCHLFRHLECGRPQPASSDAQYAHHATLGSKGEAGIV